MTSGLDLIGSTIRTIWKNYRLFNGFYNLTSTYNIDSDFPGQVESSSGMYWELNDDFNIEADFTENKTHLAAALISNCNSATSLRIKYVNELKNFIDVDLFGSCGKKCPEYFENTKIKGGCKAIIGHSFKFFLAFENSYCRDYISERFFEILEFNIVPVVRGLANYDYYVSFERFLSLEDFYYFINF